ncbi:MAG: MBL fold metallo-hydrolase [Clostridia bacterium]|nr:MBL fold metallo-hydrolase [Clostridia bacterium]
MNVRYLGHSCFQITSEQGTTIITDPYTGVGYELPSGLMADAVTVSHAHFDHNYTQAVQTDTVISSLGAHRVANIEIMGIHSWHDGKNGLLRGENIICKFNVDGIQVCHLGDLGEDICTELAERIGAVDVLMIPVGGTYTIDALQAKSLIGKLSPKIVIPMHFKADGKLDICDVSVFLKGFPTSIIQTSNGNEVNVRKEDLPDSLQIVYLER